MISFSDVRVHIWDDVTYDAVLEKVLRPRGWICFSFSRSAASGLSTFVFIRVGFGDSPEESILEYLLR